MKTFTLKVLLVGLSFLALQHTQAQKMLDPTDTLVNYDSTHPPVQPAWGKIGKWVRTPLMDWNSDAFKAYIYQGSDFRLHFPQNYKLNDGKKYPIMVFYHGDGEEGPIYDNESTLRNGMLTFHKMEVAKVFVGFIVVMQNRFGWGTAQFINLQNLIDTLVQEYGGDPYRVIQNGLSGGGQGVWQQLTTNPTYFAASIPMSAAFPSIASPTDVNTLKFTPIWNLDGGLDTDPPPYEAQLVANAYLSAGSNYVYTNFPGAHHDTWDSTWAEPNFWPYVNNAYLSNPWPLYGRTMFCPGTNIRVTIGIVPGLDGYQWRRNDTIIAGATTDSIVVTRPGTYDARVLRGTTWSDWSHVPVVISSGLPPLTWNTTQPTCTVATGSITIGAPVTDTLYYSLNGQPFTTKAVWDSLAPGIYHITIKNNLCTASTFADTIKPQPVTPAKPVVTVTQPSCTSPGGEGVISIKVVDTTFTYSIFHGRNYSKTAQYMWLPQAEYLITAESPGGCVSINDTVFIGAKVLTPAEPNVTVTQPSGTILTGTIAIDTTVVDTGLVYSINNSVYQPGIVFSHLAAGTYPVTAKNKSGCSSKANTVVINGPKGTTAAPTLAIAQPTCSHPTGTITITSPVASGTNDTLIYSIDDSTWQKTPTFNGVAPGAYSVKVKSVNGWASSPASAVIQQRPTAPAAPAVTITQPTCTTGSGSIIISAADTGLEYSINGTTYLPDTAFKNLTAGTYKVTAQSSPGCVSSATAAVVNPITGGPATPALLVTQPTCTAPTGSIKIISPIDSGYAYRIADSAAFQPAPIFPGVAPGTYHITVKGGANGCMSSPATAVILQQPMAPAAPAVTVTQPTCATGSGSIIISAADTGLEYSINGTTYLPDTAFKNLTAGTYKVTAQRSPGCVSSATAAVVNPITGSPATPALLVTQPTCTVPTGSITIISPIDSGYAYRIADSASFQPVPLFPGVAPGTYYITVKGGTNGCVSSPATAIVRPSPALAAPSVTVTQATCNISTGAITITTPVGMAYQYSTNGTNYQSDTVISPLSPGSYQVTVKDTAGCVSPAATAQILPPPTSCASCVAASHTPFNGFGLSANPGVATTLWFNLHTKLTADQLTTNGDYLLFSSGTLALSGIYASIDSTVALPDGEIIADNTVTTPSTSFNSTRNIWITRVPLGYQSNDIFVTGAAINSSNGFTLSGTNNTTLLSGAWTSDKAFTSQWWYGLACYQPAFNTANAGSVNADDGTPIGGHSSGTPNNQTGGLVSGGSGNGGTNYTGTFSTQDNLTACVIPLPVPSKIQLTVYPNPYLGTVYFNITTSVSGTGILEFYNLLGERVALIEETQFRAGVPQTITVPMTIARKQAMIYVFEIDGKKIQGTLLPAK